MKAVCVAVLLCLLSAGQSAPFTDCEGLLRPIQISSQQMLGRWLYLGSSSDLPGSRSLGRLLTSAWLDIIPTAQSNVLTLLQTQRTYGQCSSWLYNVTFENSTMLIEEPFYLKEVYLSSDCPDCLVVHEEIISGKDAFVSLLLFSKRRSVSAPVLEMFKKQVECLKMPSPLMIDQNYEICPDPTSPTEGLDVLDSLLAAKMGHRVARLLDSIFDMFVN